MCAIHTTRVAANAAGHWRFWKCPGGDAPQLSRDCSLSIRVNLPIGVLAGFRQGLEEIVAVDVVQVTHHVTV
jgi:hypothetical protein